jgi:hypothetical protein
MSTRPTTCQVDDASPGEPPSSLQCEQQRRVFQRAHRMPDAPGKQHELPGVNRLARFRMLKCHRECPLLHQRGLGGVEVHALDLCLAGQHLQELPHRRDKNLLAQCRLDGAAHRLE